METDPAPPAAALTAALADAALTAAPSDAALTAALGDAKAYLRLDGSDEDALVTSLLAAAMALCERFTGLGLFAGPRSDRIAPGPGWLRLPAAPVSAIVSVATLDSGGTATVLPVDAYAIDIDAQGDGWVRLTRPPPRGRLQVGYTAGLSPDWPGLPAPLRQGVVRLAAHLHAHRDAPDDLGPPAAVAALWRPWRRMRLA